MQDVRENKIKLDQVEIRKFVLSDLNTFAEAAKRNADHISKYLIDGKLYKAFTIHEFAIVMREYVKNKYPYQYFGAFYQGNCIGSAVLCPAGSEFGIQMIYWVDENYQNKGVATKFVNTLTDLAFKQGYWQLEILTDVTNLASQKVLEKNGFVVIETIDTEPQGTSDTGRTLVWVKFSPLPRNPFGPKILGKPLWNRSMRFL